VLDLYLIIDFTGAQLNNQIIIIKKSNEKLVRKSVKNVKF